MKIKFRVSFDLTPQTHSKSISAILIELFISRFKVDRRLIKLNAHPKSTNACSIKHRKRKEKGGNGSTSLCTRCQNMSSVTDMLNELSWGPLESRWTKVQLTLLYKIMNNTTDIPASSYLVTASTQTRSNDTKTLRQILSRIYAYKYSFLPRTIPVWNE